MEQNQPIQLTDKEDAALARRGIIITKDDKSIGKGIYGQVFQATHVDTRIAVKSINLQKTTWPYVIIEMLVLKKIRHKNVVRLIDFFLIESGHLLIFMEFLGGKDLRGLLIDCAPMPEDQVAKLYGQFGSALAFMHNSGFAHRDLKPANILLTYSKKGAKLADFGFSSQCYDIYTGDQIKEKLGEGTTRFMSPELLDWKAHYITKGDNMLPGWPQPIPYCPFLADIWALGIIVFLMLHGSAQFPFNSYNFISFGKVDCAKAFVEIYYVPARLDRRLKPSLSDAAKNFVTRHLMLEPEDRSDMDQILENEWMAWLTFINRNRMTIG